MKFGSRQRPSRDSKDSVLPSLMVESLPFPSRPSSIKGVVKWQSASILDDLHTKRKKVGDALWSDRRSGFHDADVLRAFSWQFPMLEEKGVKEKAEESNVYRIFVSGDFTAYHQFDKTVDVKRVYTSMCVTMSGGFELIYSFVKKWETFIKNSKGHSLIAFTLIDASNIKQILNLDNWDVSFTDYSIVGRNYGFLDEQKLGQSKEISITSASTTGRIGIGKKVKPEDIGLFHSANL